MDNGAIHIEQERAIRTIAEPVAHGIEGGIPHARWQQTIAIDSDACCEQEHRQTSHEKARSRRAPQGS
jgi:hypothetical protein